MSDITAENTPYAYALQRWAGRGVERLLVPGHSAQAQAVPVLTEFLGGPRLLELDVPPMIPTIDLEPDSPYQQARGLAARAWGAKRTWFLGNGSSQANRVVALVLAFLGAPEQTVVTQRSVHSSFIDGIILAGLDARYVLPAVDHRLGIAHGVRVSDLHEALAAATAPKAAYVVSPSFFGAVADVQALADVAHSFGVPLVVDSAWAAHFGFHPDLPEAATRLGADLVVMSTHKLGGSLTQSAILHLCEGEFAETLEPLIDRAFHYEQSTSENSILLASIDLARYSLEHAHERIGASISYADELREAVRTRGRFAVASDAFADFPDIVAVDPLRYSVDVGAGGLIGHRVRDQLLAERGVYFEVATGACVVGLVPPGVVPNVSRIITALHGLPEADAVPGEGSAQLAEVPLPAQGPRAMLARDAAFAPNVVVPTPEAIGRVSADTLAAYPPGIPNVIPGEVITSETVEFLQHIGRAPAGLVRGSLDPTVTKMRVVAD